MKKSFQDDNTMSFIIDNHLYVVSADGCDCVVRTEKGEFRHKDTWRCEPEKEDIPTMFFTALAGTNEGEFYPDYKAWLHYICEADSEDNRQTHASYVLQAMQWNSISELTADEVLTFLSENYEI